MGLDSASIRKILHKPRRKTVIIGLCLLVVVTFILVWFQQKWALERRIRNLLLTNGKLEFYIPVARATHSRIIEDPAVVSEFAQMLTFYFWNRCDNTTTTSGGTAIYIRPVDNPELHVIVGSSLLIVGFAGGEKYSCAIFSEAPMRKAALIANFAYPILSDHVWPKK